MSRIIRCGRSAGSLLCVVFAAACLLFAAGCATSGLTRDELAREQACVLLGRFVTQRPDAIPPAARPEIEARAEEAEDRLIADRFRSIRRERDESAKQVPVYRELLSELDAGLFAELPPGDLPAELQGLIPDAGGRNVFAAWAREGGRVEIDRWRIDPEIVRLRGRLASELRGLEDAFANDLGEAQRHARDGAFMPALAAVMDAARYDPGNPNLAARFRDTVTGLKRSLDELRGRRAYWEAYGALAELHNWVRDLSPGQSPAAWVRELNDVVSEAYALLLSEAAEFLVDRADKAAVVERRPAQALVLCAMLEELAALVDEVDMQEGQGLSIERSIAKYRAKYDKQTDEFLRRRVIVMANPAVERTTDTGRFVAALHRDITTVVKALPDHVWGVSVGARDGESGPADGDYAIERAVIEKIEVTGPTEVDKDKTKYTTVHDPETGYADGKRRQLVITHYVSRKTFRQRARLTGSVMIRHRGSSERFALDVTADHDYVEEDENFDKRKSEYKKVVLLPKKAREFRPVFELAIDEGRLNEEALGKAVDVVTEHVVSKIAAFPQSLEASARAAESASRWGEAADCWGQLWAYRARAGGAVGEDTAGAATSDAWGHARRSALRRLQEGGESR